MQTHQHTRSLISQNPYRSYVILSIWKTNSTRIKSINQKEQRSLITFPTVPSAAERPAMPVQIFEQITQSNTTNASAAATDSMGGTHTPKPVIDISKCFLRKQNNCFCSEPRRFFTDANSWRVRFAPFSLVARQISHTVYYTHATCLLCNWDNCTEVKIEECGIYWLCV